MRQPPVAKKDSTAKLIPEARPRSPWRVTHVSALPQFRLRVRFVDGLEGTVDMSALVLSDKAGVFAVLANVDRFNQAHVERGAVTWPNELDLAPDAMYDAIKQFGEWRLV
jgi:hypothetical protein